VLVYLGLVPSALAYGLFFTGLRTVPGAVASIVTLLEPVTATALATLVLGQHLPAAALAGGVLVLGAVAVLSVRGRGAQAPRPATRRSASGRRSATRG
jgi:DME family drug/metabolite transporter